MTDPTLADVLPVLEHPAVQQAVSHLNAEKIERRQYVPPRCAAFAHRFTRLEASRQYEFEVDREARRLLPQIIGNQVQTVVGTDELPHDARQKYQRPRKIGIVFSGGPAPGGHNVIAGLYDAAKAVNPDTRIYGFLMGPQGVIENEVIELNGALVDCYRNLGGFTMIRTAGPKSTPPARWRCRARPASGWGSTHW